MSKLAKDMNGEVDKSRLNDALDATSFLSDNFIESGKYIVDETWGPEGNLYLAEASYALLNAYEITEDGYYLEAVKSILEYLRKVQKPSGGWALELGKYGDGVGFNITNEVKKITEEIEDLPPTVAALKTISDYQRLSGDDEYLDMGERAFEYLMYHWDEDYGSFVEKENNELMALRSKPRSYHIFSLLGILAWNNQAPEETDPLIPKILNFVKETFESYDETSMPLVYGLHAGVLIQHSSKKYIKNVIKPRIDNHLVNNDTFRIKERKGAYGHRDGLRGIVKDEGHMRSSAGIAIAMKLYDISTNTRTYRDTKEYQDIADWIQSMKGDGFYYEYEKINENKKIGKGSPGQYLPVWWILGKI